MSMNDAIYAYYAHLNGGYSVRERDAAFAALGVTLDDVLVEVDADAYSDMHKELHGVRPAGDMMRSFRLMPEAFRKRVLDDIQSDLLAELDGPDAEGRKVDEWLDGPTGFRS